ncbi:hypothetical protein SPF06_06990 [Sinomonas sp. JGH33]|uniref:Holin n=1 Tax=Sinomonas terricola TaxID=3110330 RepID=A0ABU5T477_9MICC|nr:hypothetical protein [Sinomonas sp. JGH33]MEA5454462.1 hypothetical protein [Sinomonas sp. JGH33]
MADHVAEAAGPTQAAHPWRASVRTFVQTVIPAAIGFGLLVPAVVDAFVSGFGQQLPPAVVAWLTAAALAVGALAATLARIMALPAVVVWTGRWLPWIAPAPPGGPATQTGPGTIAQSPDTVAPPSPSQ